MKMQTLANLWTLVYSNLAISLPLAITAVSSLLVGLTKYPKAYTLASDVMKVLNLLSLVVHADSPGSLKLPLTQSREPGAGNLPGSGPVALSMLLPFLAIAALTIPGCACSNPANKVKFGCKVEQGLIDCSTAQAGKAISQAATDVEAAITGTSINWVALATVEATYGVGIVACVIQMLDAAPASGPAAMSTSHRNNIHENAKTYYAARRIRFR